MSDDISIPRGGPSRTAYTHSYRARRNGLDAGTKNLMLAAGGVVLLLAGGMAVWTVGGHRTAGPVPTIEADTRPLRIRPANPGGMSLIGLADLSPNGQSGPTDLAPAAEIPDPQALRAQRQSAVQSETPALATPTFSIPAPTPTMAAPALSLAAVAPAPPAAPSIATPAALTSRPAASSGPLVQLAAVGSEKEAATEWQRLAKKMPDLLAEHALVTQKTDLAGKTMWRVRTGGFNDVADATQFCKRVHAKGGGCSLATF